MAVEEGPAELVYRDKSPKAMENTPKEADRTSKEAVWASDEARKGRGEEEEGSRVGFTPSSLAAMGGVLVVFRRENRMFCSRQGYFTTLLTNYFYRKKTFGVLAHL